MIQSEQRKTHDLKSNLKTDRATGHGTFNTKYHTYIYNNFNLATLKIFTPNPRFQLHQFPQNFIIRIYTRTKLSSEFSSSLEPVSFAWMCTRAFIISKKRVHSVPPSSSSPPRCSLPFIQQTHRRGDTSNKGKFRGWRRSFFDSTFFVRRIFLTPFNLLPRFLPFSRCLAPLPSAALPNRRFTRGKYVLWNRNSKKVFFFAR